MTEIVTPLNHKLIGVAVIWNDRGEILIDRRYPGGVMGGLWEFPGGKIEVGETVEACIIREIREELDIEIKVGKPLINIDYNYSEFQVTLKVYECQHISGEPQPLESAEIRWVTLDEIDRFEFPAANTQIISALRQNRC